jgi:hypothetical protein
MGLDHFARGTNRRTAYTCRASVLAAAGKPVMGPNPAHGQPSAFRPVCVPPLKGCCERLASREQRPEREAETGRSHSIPGRGAPRP